MADRRQRMFSSRRFDVYRRTTRRGARTFPLSEEERRRNRRKSAIRCRVEHIFGVIKHRFGWRKVRFRGIFKNFQYALAVAASVNVYLHRRVLIKRNPAFTTA